MNVLIHSRVFLPSFGGLEKMMDLIATEIAAAGHHVTVATLTPSTAEVQRPYQIVRSPTLPRLVKEAMAADVCVVANVTLRATPLLLLLGRRVVTIHHGLYLNTDRFDPRGWLKRATTHLTWNVSCSSGVRQHIPAASIVIPNSYDSDLFHSNYGEIRDKDVVFVGRLVSDKGCDVLIDAIAHLRDSGRIARLTIIGSGVEQERLETRVRALNLTATVEFAGRLEGEALARNISRHRVLAIPSTCEEGFGLVALEGAACGCAIVGTDGGGLPEAIGPTGIVVPRGNVAEFANGLRKMLSDGELRARCLAQASPHLDRHHRIAIGKRYVSVLERIVRGQDPTENVTSPG